MKEKDPEQFSMSEAVGKLVVLNGKFIVIDNDDPDKKEGTKGLAEVVKIYSRDEEKRKREIDFSVRSFASGSGGHFKSGDTSFIVSGIWRLNSSNDAMLVNHVDPTRMVAVKNEETGEFFLIMSEYVSIRSAKDFLESINKEIYHNKESPFNSITGGSLLSLPYEIVGPMRVGGNTRFEVETNNGLAAIKLRLL